MKAFVSVLMPVFNGAKFVGDAIESILAQTHRHFEFLIIDDGSTDQASEILASYSKRDGRIRLISRENRGLVASLNEGLGLARGEFIARMDGDDVCLPERLELQVQFLGQRPEVVCVGTQFELMDADGLPYYRSSWPTDPDEIERRHLETGYCVLHASTLIRRSALAQIGGYSTECYPAEDNDLLLKLGEVGKLSNIDRVLYLYRIHASSISSMHHIRQWEGGNRAIKNAWLRRGLPGEAPRRDLPLIGERVASDDAGLVRRGWMAWCHGYRGTAKTYAWRVIRRSPCNRRAWMLCACALFKDAQKGRWFT